MLLMTFEGLTPAAIACMGSSWNRTSQFDQLAAIGTTLDRVICTAIEGRKVIRQWFEEDLADFREFTVVTDDQELFDESLESRIGELVLLPDTDPDRPVASDISDTHLARLTSIAIERLESGDHVWLHSRFLCQCWDAPRDLMWDPLESTCRHASLSIL